MSKPLIAFTHVPSPRMNECVRTHVAYEPIDVARAAAQHESYRQALARAGAEVHVLETNTAHPDCVFIEDTAIVLDEMAILTSMGNPSRRPEPAGIEPSLKRYRDVVRVTLPALLDGGDVLVVPNAKTILVGRTSRTDAAGIESLAVFARRLGYEVTTVDVRGCLHLKTAATALPDGALLVNPPWVDREDLKGHELVPVPRDEPHAANVVCVGERVVMSSAYPRTAEIVRKRGFKVEVVDLSEFAKGEGCGTCLSLIFRS